MHAINFNHIYLIIDKNLKEKTIDNIFMSTLNYDNKITPSYWWYRFATKSLYQPMYKDLFMVFTQCFYVTEWEVLVVKLRVSV